ncbi:MAG: energy transducer TonB [Sphingomonadales bacterium]|nr:energy transducer TonB [Sphingomonadales bacterium]
MAAAGIEGLIVAGLLLGLAAPASLRRAITTLTAIDLREPPPPKPHPTAHHEQHGGASGAIRAPEPRIAPPPVRVALAPPVPAAAGAAQAGTGAGANGRGAGLGQGDGSGDGGGTDAEWIKGRIENSDYPHDAREAREQGTTRVEIAVDASGRPSGCTVRHSSGSGQLDQTTCRLVLKRFRFNPARDAAGHAVADAVDYDQEWSITGYMGD